MKNKMPQGVQIVPNTTALPLKSGKIPPRGGQSPLASIWEPTYSPMLKKGTAFF
jgi:hypothetical protein